MSKQVHVYDTHANKWEKKLALGDTPTPLKNHAACQMGPNLIVYGGEDSKGVVQSQLYVLNINEFRWHQVNILEKDKPGPRSHSTLTPVSQEGFSSKFSKSGIYLFGGLDEHRAPVNKVYSLVVRNQNFKWSYVHATGQVPIARYSHSAYSLRNKLFVFGGRNDNIPEGLNDLHGLDTETLRWERYNLVNDPPPGRWGHCMTSYSGCSLLVLGGLTYKTFHPSYVYELRLQKS